MRDKVLWGEQEHGAGMRLMLPQLKRNEELISAYWKKMKTIREKGERRKKEEEKRE